MKKTHNPFLLIFIIAIIALAGVRYKQGVFILDEQIKKGEIELLNLAKNLDETPLLARAVSVYDITDNKKIYGKRDNVSMPIASLAKIMTVLVSLQGHDLNDVVTISKPAINQFGDYGVLANEKWKIGDLARFTLVASANDGAYALSQNDSDFLEKANTRSKRIGMQGALFSNFTGLDILQGNASTSRGGDALLESISEDHGGVAGAYATAEEVNRLAWYALLAKPTVFSATTLPEIDLKSESGFTHKFKNTNPLVGKIPNLLFSKTGFTELAGGNLAIIFEDSRGHKIAVTVLGSTFDGRFSDMEKIVNVLYSFPYEGGNSQLPKL